MRRAVIAASLVLAVCLSASATLRIDRFDAEIELLEDGRLTVVESITVSFLTPHHGIEREIPVSYRVPSTGANLTIDFDLDRVALDGGPVPVLSKRRGRNRYLRIGDPDRTITGAHTYVIGYTVDRVLLFHDEYLQLYWNVTGNDWSIPIGAATATVRLPSSVDPSEVATTSYVGYAGQSARGAATVDPEGRWSFAGGPFSPGEGLTIDISVPRSALPVAPPSAASKVLRFLDANKAAALPIVALLVMIAIWFRTGRDPRKGIIAPAFVPPRGMHPGHAGVLIDDRIDLRDISAMVVGLAVKGHLRIEEIRDEEPGVVEKVKGLLGRSGPLDYRFVKLGPDAKDLAESERAVLEAIFPSDETERTLSSLESRFYKHLPTIKSRLYSELIEADYYAGNPERTRGTYRTLGLIGLGGGIALGITYASLVLGISVALCGLVVLAFSPFMPRKTRKGVGALEEILGLSEYIRLAEVERMEFHNAPEKSPEVFERLLPYAIALNLTTIWTEQFEGLLNEPPSWYVSSTPVFRGHLFAASLWHLSAGMNRTFASAPRAASSGRSAWGGGSSFGGGFSGGGFGGGGGGGW